MCSRSDFVFPHQPTTLPALSKMCPPRVWQMSQREAGAQTAGPGWFKSPGLSQPKGPAGVSWVWPSCQVTHTEAGAGACLPSLAGAATPSFQAPWDYIRMWYWGSWWEEELLSLSGLQRIPLHHGVCSPHGWCSLFVLLAEVNVLMHKVPLISCFLFCPGI